MMRKILFILFAVLLSVFASAQSNSRNKTRNPRLVVGITIEHMRADYIDRYWDTFQNGGFKQLYENGAVFSNTRVDIHNIKAATIIPTIYTGTYPSEHGIVADKWYKQLTGKEIHSVNDDFYLTLGSDSEEGNVSANQLKVFTLGDAMRQNTNQKSKVYSVSLNAASAVLSGGHMANGVYWYDKTNGKMISSSYYIDKFPDWVLEFNNQKMPDAYLKKEWDLLLPKGNYKAGFSDNYILEEGYWKKWNTFPYKLKKLSENQEYPLEIIKATPYGNKLLRDFAIQLIYNEGLGEDENPDLLNITFSTLDYANKWFNPSSVEIQEIYLRMDQDIAALLQYLDVKMGKGNYLVFLTSASTSTYPVKVMKEEFNFNVGDFSPQSAMALLKSYLNITYGVDDWIVMYNEEQVYLNHNLIDKREKSLNEMREKAASFLNQFSGVKAAVPAHVIEIANFNSPRFNTLENSYCVQRSGDILLILEEGWFPTHRYHQADYTTENRMPLVFYGNSVKEGEFDEKTELIDIVPTICNLLQISSPDDAKGKVLNGMQK